MTLLTGTKPRQVCPLDHLDTIGFRTFLPRHFKAINGKLGSSFGQLFQAVDLVSELAMAA